MKSSLLFSLLCLFALSGCLSSPDLTGQPFFTSIEQPPADQAYIYFLRPDGPIGTGLVPRIKIDGREVGTLPSGSYFRTAVTSGTYRIESTTPPILSGAKDKSFELRVESGNTYFIADQQSSSAFSDGATLGEIDEGRFGGIRFYFRYALMDQDEALRALEYCRQSPL